MFQFRDNRLDSTRHAVTMQSLRLHAAVAAAAIIMAMKVAFEKEVAP
jgi:hypothetical protein